MPRIVTVITPENVPLRFELAGLGTRFGAYLIDLTLQLVLIIALLIILGITSSLGGKSGIAGGESVLGAIALISLFLIWFGYFLLFESIWNGQTPGKRALKIRVVRDGGYPATFFNIATRNLLRIVDSLPLLYAVGGASSFFHSQYKRLGDLAGGTIVIKEQNRRMGIHSGSRDSIAPQFSGQLPNGFHNPYDILTTEELELLRRFAVRRWQMDADDSERLGYRLIAPIVGRLNITFLPGAPPRYADLASALVAAADRREEELTGGRL
ncbi:MAG: RDD family protein [bacterium]|jgi:uncharacterized RDD family membrane protein YckC